MSDAISTQKQDIATTPEKSINSQSQKKTIILDSDKEYIETYFDICRIYYLKRSVLNKPKGAISRLRLSKKEKFTRRISILNNCIQKQEDAFWQKVEDGKKRGVKFVFEEIADNYKLDLYEKKILLFFFYLEYFIIEKNVCMEDELLYIFDTKNYLLSRMCDMDYFRVDATLLREYLLCREFNSNSRSARARITLSSKAIDIVSAALNGRQCIERCFKCDAVI